MGKTETSSKTYRRFAEVSNAIDVGGASVEGLRLAGCWYQGRYLIQCRVVTSCDFRHLKQPLNLEVGGGAEVLPRTYVINNASEHLLWRYTKSP